MGSIYAPIFASRATERFIGFCDDSEGRPQVVTYDGPEGRRCVLTATPRGVTACDVEPDGRFVWWFDANPAGRGVWLRQPFGGGPADPAMPGMPPGRQYGLAFSGAGELAAVSMGVGDRSLCYVGAPGGAARLVVAATGYVGVVDLTVDGGLLALAGRPDGPQAVTITRTAVGATAVALAGSRCRRLWGLEFRPGPHPPVELLLIIEEDGRYKIGTWRAGGGVSAHAGLSFDSEITAWWYGGGRRLLIRQDRAGRSRLLLADLDGDEPTLLPTPPGTIEDLACAPDGRLHYVWSRAGTPPQLLVTDPVRDTVVPSVAPTRSTSDEMWTVRSYGSIHTLLATPGRGGPWPTLFLVHGGPFWHDRDSYDPRVEMLTRAGYAVARTNYRGSTGYGPYWQRAFGHRVGLAQVEDLAAVRDHLVDLGIAAPDRIGLCGYSWGGYLVLLAMGLLPYAWAVGLAASPIADYPAAYRAATPALREVDEELFGGTPDEVPERYREASPMTYVDSLCGPLLIAAATNDESCPPAQVRSFEAALRRRDIPHRVIWTDGGHVGADAADHTAVFMAMLDFARAAMEPAMSGVGARVTP